MEAIKGSGQPESGQPGGIVDRLQRELNRLFSGFSRVREPGARVFPPVNISEAGDDFVVRAEMPGIEPEQIEVTIHDEAVTIRGEKKAETAEGANFHRREREGGSFDRVLTLPRRIDPEKAVVTFKDGILKLVLPRAREIPPRQVKVSVE